MDILEKLFGSAAKVKIIKLFLMNPDTTYDAGEASLRSKASIGVTRKEIYNLEKIGFLRPGYYMKTVRRQKNRQMMPFRKKVSGWTLDSKFPYIDPMLNFLSNVNPFKHSDIIDKISRAGKIQLLIISGLFIKYGDARVDLLVVGDNLKMGMLDNIIKTIESEIGKEMKYAVFETKEFLYRQAMVDKLIRDILDFPHEKIINRLNI